MDKRLGLPTWPEMFVLATLEEDIDVEPCEHNKPLSKAVSDVIERDFIDKVIPDIGLVVSLWDIQVPGRPFEVAVLPASPLCCSESDASLLRLPQSIEGGVIVPSEGPANYNVRFRVVSFLPFVGEVLVGTLGESDKIGVTVFLGDFFKDVFVPECNLPEPSVYISEDTSGGVWRWDFDGNELFLDRGEQVRIRIKEVRFNKIPTPAAMKEDAIGTAPRQIKQKEVIADMNEDGLGAITWWNNADPGGDEEAE